jgi:hypothetical protein
LDAAREAAVVLAAAASATTDARVLLRRLRLLLLLLLPRARPRGLLRLRERYRRGAARLERWIESAPRSRIAGAARI